MRPTLRRSAVALLFVLSAVACHSATEPVVAIPVLPEPPDLVATVSTNSFQDFVSPEGPISQYDIWVTISPGTSANAGVVVGKSISVFLRMANGKLSAASPSSIRPGDSVQVWHDGDVIYDSSESPSGSPAYSATQVVILR